MLLVSPEFLLLAGPALLFLMAVAETSMPLGLLVPAGVALASGAFLASQGSLPIGTVLVAAGVGGLVGDSLGYWLGRTGFSRLLSVQGFVARTARHYERFTTRLYRKHALVSVSLARTISFVRTLMPATAGMAGMAYPRFLFFDVLGVLAWLALYAGVGILAGESWKAASTLVGTGWAGLLVLLAVSGWLLSRRRRRRGGITAVPESVVEGEGGPVASSPPSA